MEPDTCTERALDAIKLAGRTATSRHHQRITPLHLLYSLIAGDDPMARQLIETAGGQPEEVRAALDEQLAKIPAVEGTGADTARIDGDLSRVLIEADSRAKREGDSFVTTEILLLAIATCGGATAKALSVAPALLEAAIRDMRAGRNADSQQAEERYDALKRFTRDITEMAEKSELDP
ncbi:MAG: Clp protease N-terminal domain-containing protein, partial [Pseudomonadota bacterium]|nr:Clp protease N-terminal domain-containing protein [Pseudomonadota bacterium]